MEDSRLIERILRGDYFAFKLLVERYQDFIFTIAYRVLKTRQEAEEIAQDVFLKVHKQLDTFEKRSSFKTWLYTIAYRCSIDALRKKKISKEKYPEEMPEKIDHSPGIEAQLERRQLRQQLESVVAELPGEEAAVITLFYFDELTVKEVADITGLTETNVKTKLFRSREVMRKKLLPYFEMQKA